MNGLLIAKELIRISKLLVAISCPSGWKPSSTGQTCTDGNGEYRKPEESVKPGRLGEQEAHSLVHNKLDEHLKNKPKDQIHTILQSLSDKAKNQQNLKTKEDQQKNRQLQEGIISYAEKHGIKIN